MADETKQNAVMLAKDTISASLAECYITIGDRRYNFMQAINLEAKFEKTKTEVPILGKTGKGNKSTGWTAKSLTRLRAAASYSCRCLRLTPSLRTTAARLNKPYPAASRCTTSTTSPIPGADGAKSPHAPTNWASAWPISPPPPRDFDSSS